MLKLKCQMANVSDLKIALVHDYLNEFGGAERVLLVLHEIWPEAPICTIFCKRRLGELGRLGKLGEAKIIESWFGKIPFCDRLISPLRFLIPLIWGSFDFSKYDLVITSASWAITKGLIKGKDKGKVKEICYCHTPPRYLYGYETSRDWQKHWWIRVYAAIVNHFMRMYDYNQAQKVDYFVANSREVANRIRKFYRREAVVINPPVEIPSIKYQVLSIKKKNYFLTGGRLEAAKNFDLIIKACNELKIPLKMYGSGSQEKYLRSIARGTVEFVGRVSDEEREKLMAECRAFIVAATDEDFGITPVEAMACGAPVIAYRGGGYLETVIGEKTGVFFDEATAEGVIRGIRDFEGVGREIKPEDCRKQAEKFSKERFKKEIKKFVKKRVNLCQNQEI